jgi:DNA-binding MarR family transcriptional regulator
VEPISYQAAAEFRAELRRFLRRSEECAREHGITPAQHLLLLQIAGSESGQTTVSELVDKLSLTQSTVTELVQRAARDGLLARRTSTTDGRVVHLSLTEDGHDKLKRVHSELGVERAQLRRMIDRLERGPDTGGGQVTSSG